MSVASQQHDDIASELKSSFANNPLIEVKSTGTGSTEEYEVTFKSRGLTIDDNDEVKESRNHIIQVTVPFGFPLFPPSCKPLTPVFHPDFDPGAICLGDFWDQDRTCTELIEFLAKMITGEVFSKENAFNEKAAVWYIAHADQFPLVDDGEAIALEAVDTASEFELDTVQDEDFSTDFDYLSLDTDDVAEDQEDIFKESQDYDLELLQERLSQKRFQQLDRELNAIPINVEFEEREFLRTQTDDALIESKKLQKKGQQLEAADDLEGALKEYQKAKETVADLYGVEATIQRLQQAISLAKSIGQPKEEPEEVEEDDVIEEEPKTKLFGKFNLQVPNVNFSRKYLLIFPAVLAVWLGLYALTSSKQAKITREYFTQCQQNLSNRQFREAQSLCEKAEHSSRDVGFIYTSEMNTLGTNAKNILQSQELLQGLEGKILVDGVWVYEDEAIRISPFETLVDQTEEVIASKNWNKATKLVRQASPLAKTEQEKSLISEMSKAVVFYKTSDEALTAYDKGGCNAAESLLLKAQRKAKDIPISIRNKHLPEISYRLTKCTFDQLIGEGNKLYEATDWNDALPVYRDALKKIENSPFPERIAIADIKSKISKAELYSAIDNGNRAFAANEWTKAITKYEDAVQLIESDPELSKAENSLVTSKKLTRIILQAKIIQSQQKIKSLKAEQRFDEAIAECNNLRIIVTESQFKADDDFARIQTALDDEVKNLKKQAVIEKQRQYLITNYLDLFQENYPAASADTLKDPVATFVSDKDGQMIFKLQATEIGRGRPLALVMFYAYNKTTKQWKFTKNPESQD